MPIPQFQASDLLRALQRLLPRGPAWPRDPDAVMTQALATLMPMLERVLGAAGTLITEALPATTDLLLPEWQATLGLPDPCAGPNPSTEQQRAQVVARFSDTGGQTKAYMIGFAADLGYQIEINEFAPFRFGQARFGQPFGGTDWASAWQIVAPSTTSSRFEFGRSNFGDPFASWGNSVLVCEMQTVAPAHTVLLFSFVLPAS